jgi:hypothetical protein
VRDAKDRAPFDPMLWSSSSSIFVHHLGDVARLHSEKSSTLATAVLMVAALP